MKRLPATPSPTPFSMSDEISLIETTTRGHMHKTEICYDETANDLSPSLLDAIIDSQRIPAVTEAIRQILTAEAHEYTDSWVNRDTGATLSDLEYFSLPRWQTVEYKRTHTRARAECNNPEEEE